MSFCPKFCRLCFSDLNQLVTISTIEGDAILLSDKLRSVCDIQIKENDGLPETICVRCQKKLCQFYEFKITCLRSNMLLFKHKHELRSRKNNKSVLSKLRKEIKPLYVDLGEACEENERGLTSHHIEQMTIDVTTPDSGGDDYNDEIEVETVVLYLCDDCDQPFNDECKSNKHVQGSRKRFKCGMCDKMYETRSGLRHHKVIHTGERPYQCNQCPKSFTTNASLKHHLIAHSDERPFECYICKKAFKFKCKLQAHIRTHTGEKPHQCPKCHKSFIHLFELKNHQKVVHSEKSTTTAESTTESHQCQFCGLVFETKNRLSNHLRTHREKIKEISLSPCPICGKLFTDKHKVRSHLKKHSTEKPYQCDVCFIYFKWKSVMKKHRQTHFPTILAPEKSFTCAICGKNFELKDSYQKHLKVHSDERPFSCDKCGTMFKHECSLRSHMKYHENENLSYKCEVCGKEVKYKSTLRKHLKIHQKKTEITSYTTL